VDGELSDGDLVRLARDGDPVAFRMLVERYRPMAVARARSLGAGPDEVEDIVQDALLQAFVALPRLRDPDRFAGWLGGIVVNIHRAASRRSHPLDLLADWPEQLHPISADGLPEAAVDTLDRGAVLGGALDDLTPQQREAIQLYYYADLPLAGIADRLADTPAAVKARLHKARLHLREHIVEHRPDLIPYLPRRTLMTTVRILRAEHRPRLTGAHAYGRTFVLLGDEAQNRALPLWLTGSDGIGLKELVNPGDEDRWRGNVEEFTGSLLKAVGATLASVSISEVGPHLRVARMEIRGPAGTHRVIARPGDALTYAVIHHAPIRVDDELMDRLAGPIDAAADLPDAFLDSEHGPDDLGPHAPVRLLGPAPRNLDFADALDGWFLVNWSRTGRFHRQLPDARHADYRAEALGGGIAVLASAAPDLPDSAALSQAVHAEQYRNRTLTVRADLRADDLRGVGALYLWVVTGGTRTLPYAAADRAPADTRVRASVESGADWARHEVSAPVPGDATFVIFGVTLRGPGRIEVRDVEVATA
jgi:RNA polymerase sigma factor (sigma-70 family)